MNVSTADRIWLRRYSKLVCLATFFLIFAGSMVTSTGSGLAVPDWPLSYGMFFPPMVGGIFYEHGHRLVAATVGLLTVILAVWLGFTEKRRWVRNLGYGALAAVVLQGLLGGMTVLLLLPPPVSISHAVLAQTFLLLTVLVAYSLSRERRMREAQEWDLNSTQACVSAFLLGLVFVQLLLGAVMRHTQSGLAIYDFPQAAGYWIPPFNSAMLDTINDWRFAQDLPPVTMAQVAIHYAHRIGALIVVLAAGMLNILTFRRCGSNPNLTQSVILLDFVLAGQVLLGAITVWSRKAPLITSLHVLTGAVLLGLSALLALRSFPVTRARRQAVNLAAIVNPV